MYHMVGALSKRYCRKDCMLILNSTVNNAWFAMEQRERESKGSNCSTIGTIVASSNALVYI